MNDNNTKNLISSTIGYDSALYFDYWKQQQQAAALFNYSGDPQSIYNSFYDGSMPFSTLQNFPPVLPSTQK